MQNRLEGKVVILTGASGGIGEATAQLLVQRGARVVLASRTKGKLEKLVSQLKDRGEILAVPTDITVPQEVKHLVQKTLEHFQTVDVLINNAGLDIRGSIMESSESEFRSLFETNFFGAVSCTRAVLPIFLQKRGGQILNVISLAGVMGFTYQGFYCASKFAQAGFFETLRQEVRGSGVAVSMVYPGIIETPMTAEVIQAARKKGLRLFPVSADYAALKIVQAIEEKKEKVVFPWNTRLLIWAHFFSPRLVEGLMTRFRQKIYENKESNE